MFHFDGSLGFCSAPMLLGRVVAAGWVSSWKRLLVSLINKNPDEVIVVKNDTFQGFLWEVRAHEVIVLDLLP